MHEHLGKLEPHKKITSKILGHFFLHPKEYLIGAITVICACIIVVFGALLLNNNIITNKHLKSRTSKYDPAVTASPSITPIPIPNTFPVWSTYTNHYVGYSIQIPSVWSKNAFITQEQNIGDEFEFPPDLNGTRGLDAIDLTVLSSTDKNIDICNTLKVPPQADNYFDTITLKSSPYKNIQSINFTQNEWAQKPASEFGSQANICFKSYHTTYAISYTHERGTSFKNAMSIFEKIIKSMAFIQEVYPDWMTYKNKSGGYSFQYPAKILMLAPGFIQSNSKTMCFDDTQKECNKSIQGSDTMLLNPGTYSYTDVPADYIATSVVQLDQNQTFDDFIKARKKDVTQAISEFTGNYKESNITVNGSTGISIFDTYSNPSGLPITNYYFSLPDNRVLILSKNDFKGTLDKFMPQILSTLTF